MNKTDEVLEKVKEHVSNGLKENQTDLKVYFPTMNMLNGRVGIPVEYTYNHKAKTGRVTKKKETINVYPSFCPFTGEEIKA